MCYPQTEATGWMGSAATSRYMKGIYFFIFPASGGSIDFQDLTWPLFRNKLPVFGPSSRPTGLGLAASIGNSPMWNVTTGDLAHPKAKISRGIPQWLVPQKPSRITLAFVDPTDIPGAWNDT